MDLKSEIRSRMEAQAPFGVWTPTDFLDLGSRDAVDQCLSRMTTGGDIRRITRGLYDLPRFNSLTGKSTNPDPRQVIDALARRDQARMLVDGLTAANDLGLSDAVPAKIAVHTDARLRPIKLGAQTITFKPTAPSRLYWAGRPGMRVVQALHWLRDMLSGDHERIERRLAAILADPEHGSAIAADLREGLTSLPDWMQNFLRPLLDGSAPTASEDGEVKRQTRTHP
ncbi:DUF6088 family protein [Bradyrhizobium sp. RT9a]|uniref:DUF6088 family protein n=1 Tax=Bradyrhizobium sp. RT9a TaxID=3156384 RepID=UPI0033940155